MINVDIGFTLPSVQSRQCYGEMTASYAVIVNKARIFLLVDLQEFFFKPRVGETKEK